MGNDNQIEKRHVYGWWEKLWVDMDSFPFVQPFIRVCYIYIYIYIYPIQRSLWYKKYFCLTSIIFLFCSQFLLAHVFKKQRPQKGRSSQKPSDQEIHKTKINQPTFNVYQPKSSNHNQSTNIYQPKSTNPCFFTSSNHHLLLEPTTPYLEWHHVGDQPIGDWRRSPPCLTGSSRKWLMTMV